MELFWRKVREGVSLRIPRCIVPVLLLFSSLFAGSIVVAQSPITRVEYFLDADPGIGNGTSIDFLPTANLSDFDFYLNPGNISSGVHRLFVRARDQAGSWSMMSSVLTFYKPHENISIPGLPQPAAAVNVLEYFIDEDPGIGNGTLLNISSGMNISDLMISLDTDSISEGVHRLYFRTRDEKGSWSMMSSVLTFYKPYLVVTSPELKEPARVSAIEYFIGADPGIGKAISVPLPPGTDIRDMVIPLDISGFELGDHKLYIRSRDENGSWSFINSWEFTVDSSRQRSFSLGDVGRDFCAGTEISIPVNVNVPLGERNIFTAQLSNAYGSFANPVNIGRLAANSSDTIRATIPSYTAGGSGYLIRVVASTPRDTSDYSVSAITISRVPGNSFKVSGATALCLGEEAYTIAEPSQNTVYSWTLEGGGELLAESTSAIVKWNTPGTHSLTVTSSNVCGAGWRTNLRIKAFSAVPSATPLLSSDGSRLLATGGVAEEVLGYIWYRNGEPVDTTTGPTYESPQEGSYAVALFNTCGRGPVSAAWQRGAALSIIELPAAAGEGDTIVFKISSNIASGTPVEVFISSDSRSRILLPSSVIIPSGSTSMDVAALAVQNDAPEADVPVRISLGALNHEPAQGTILLHDDDVPGIEFIIEQPVVSESGGPYATSAKLRRKPGGLPVAFTCRFTAELPNTLLLPASISLAADENEKSFYIGVVDNSTAEGQREVSILASVFLSNCGCSVSSGSSGSVSANLLIADDDGPALQMIPSSQTIAQGLSGAASIRISRNTGVQQELLVHLSSSNGFAELPESVVLPAGQAYVDVAVSTPEDQMAGTGTRVYFQAIAEGHAAGTTWVMVSDINKPDLQIPKVLLRKNNFPASAIVDYEIEVVNTGGATASSGAAIRAYLSKDDAVDSTDVLLAEHLIEELVVPGKSVAILNAAKLPETPGGYKLLFVVNQAELLEELLFTNNVSRPVNLVIDPDYTATAKVDSDVFITGENVPIHGRALKPNGTPARAVPVEIHLVSGGIPNLIHVVADSAGYFSAVFVPLPNETGHYSVSAGFPGTGAPPEQDSFDLLGVRFGGDASPQIRVALNDTVRGTLSVSNLSSHSLKNLTLLSRTLPNGMWISFDTIALVPGGASANIPYTVSGSIPSPGTNFLFAELQARSDEGMLQQLQVLYFCQPASGYLVSDVNTLNVTASSGTKQRLVEFRVVNKGMLPSGPVSIVLPRVSWISCINSEILPSIESGDTAIVTLRFLATDDVPFNYSVAGSIGVEAANGNSFRIPFGFEKVSEVSGSVKISVTNQFTYYAEGGPKVEGAHVQIKDRFSGEVYAEGITGTDGVFLGCGIPEGQHQVVVEKEKHLPYKGHVLVNCGDTVSSNIFINYRAITFNWDVTPTAVQDEYEVTLTAEFETHVPVPVVIIEMPKQMPRLAGNEEYNFNIVVTNHGLIKAEDFTLQLPENDPEYEFFMNYVMSDIPAQHSIQVPVVMRRRNVQTESRIEGSAAEALSQFLGMNGLQYRNAAGGGDCLGTAKGLFRYYCSLESGLWETTGATFGYEGRGKCRFSPGNGGGLPQVFGPGFGLGTGGPYWGESKVCATCKAPVCFDCNGINFPPPVKREKKHCVECLIGIVDVIANCFVTTKLDIESILCGNAKIHVGPHWKDNWNCGGDDLMPIPLPKAIECPMAVLDMISTCLKTEVAERNDAIMRENREAPINILRSGIGNSAVLNRIAAELETGILGYQVLDRWAREYFGSMVDANAWQLLSEKLKPYVAGVDSIPMAIQGQILSDMTGLDISSGTMSSFFARWNRSVYARSQDVSGPNEQFPGIIDWLLVKSLSDSLATLHNMAIDKGYGSLAEMSDKAMRSLEEVLTVENNKTCASVTVQIKQEAAMTREAFEGELTIFNGHPTDKMDSLELVLEIRDEEGVPCNGLFEIQVTGLGGLSDIKGQGALDAQQNGKVEILFIPEPAAAPTAQKRYWLGGMVRYWDPFVQKMVALPLSDVMVTVHPAPDLTLHYFMQRNILGDDPFTRPAVEPSIPAELAVMVENNGYGSAVNMTISSAQPEIVDNEKGLAIDFRLTGSKMQGSPKVMGLEKINFGTISPQKTKVGQWYFTSSLLGKFIGYDAEIVHSSSFGNQELSLVTGVQLHELTKSIRVYGADDDGVGDFLVNDDFDAGDVPDKIYYSQGRRTEIVHQATEGRFSGRISQPGFSNVLSVSASLPGWNYTSLPDPGNGRYDLVSVTRADGQEIPLENAWLSFVDLPLGGAPQYTDKFHIVDSFFSAEPVNYTVTWKARNTKVPEVERIIGPSSSITETQVKEITVVFNKSISAESFTYEDISIRFQGGPDFIHSSIEVTQVDSATFVIDVSSLTTGNGFYNLTVQTNGVTDLYGTPGISGKQFTWSQFLTVPMVQEFSHVSGRGAITSFDSARVLFNIPVDSVSVTPERFVLRKDGQDLVRRISVDSVSANLRMFYLSGFASLIAPDGTYELVVDLPNIRSSSGEPGMQPQIFTFTMDNTGPQISTLETAADGGLDGQHIPFVNIAFNEEVSGFNIAAIRLTRNGELLPLRIDQLSNRDLAHWSVGNFGLLTYPEGIYSLTIDLSLVADSLGNSGSGLHEINWEVNRSATLKMSELRVFPDHGWSATDGVTYNKEFEVRFRLDADASQINVLQRDLSGEIFLKSFTNVRAGEVSLPVSMLAEGNTALKIAALNNNTGKIIDTILNLQIDPVPLYASWFMPHRPTMEDQIDSIYLSFSSKLLSDMDLMSAISFSRNGIPISKYNLSLTKESDTLYCLYNLRSAGVSAGEYKLALDCSMLNKFSSGKAGERIEVVSWTVARINHAPVANAGRDTLVTHRVVRLDGSSSYDADADSLSYTWIAPEEKKLNDSASASPQFSLINEDKGKSYRFLLIVSDGVLFSTDVVNIVVNTEIEQPLPVRLVEFKAYPKEREILLEWVTAGEYNNGGFFIERATSNPEGFTSIGWVPGKGSSGGVYQKVDGQVRAGIDYYYRLKQVDLDGKTVYSEIRRARVSDIEANSLRLSPNPADRTLILDFNGILPSTRILINVVNLAGVIVLHREFTLAASNTKIELDVSTLLPGQYFIEVGSASKERRTVEPFIKK